MYRLRIFIIRKGNIDIDQCRRRHPGDLGNAAVADGSDGVIVDAADDRGTGGKPNDDTLNVLVPHDIADREEVVGHDVEAHDHILQCILQGKTDNRLTENAGG